MATQKKQIKVKNFKIVKPVAESDKCPPQSKLIVDTILAAGDSGVSREDLLTALKRPPAEGGLTTNQTAERILSFYTPKLTAMGVLEVEVLTKEIEVEVPDKPVKEPVAAGDAGPAGEPASEGGKGKKGSKKQEAVAA